MIEVYIGAINLSPYLSQHPNIQNFIFRGMSKDLIRDVKLIGKFGNDYFVFLSDKDGSYRVHCSGFIHESDSHISIIGRHAELLVFHFQAVALPFPKDGV